MQLTYTEQELMQDHPDLQPQVILGQRVHGGFDDDGHLWPPTRPRARAGARRVDRGAAARGGDVFDADSSLLAGARVVSVAQQRVLLRNGLGQWFWDQLTITGKIEARGRLLADIAFPDLQPVIVDDISEMAIGHLGGGLLVAHGLDEGGQPDLGIGGHDVMWFLARDLAFGDDAYADAEPPGEHRPSRCGHALHARTPAGDRGPASRCSRTC